MDFAQWRVGFRGGVGSSSKQPSAAKAASFLCSGGTAEAVPFHLRALRHPSTALRAGSQAVPSHLRSGGTLRLRSQGELKPCPSRGDSRQRGGLPPAVIVSVTHPVAKSATRRGHPRVSSSRKTPAQAELQRRRPRPFLSPLRGLRVSWRESRGLRPFDSAQASSELQSGAASHWCQSCGAG